MNVADILTLLQLRCDEAGSLGAWARVNGIAPAYVTDVLRGNRPPGPKITDALGVERVVSYEERSDG